MKFKVFLIIFVLSLLFCGCDKKPQKYKEGDIVMVKLDKRVGVVIYYNPFSEEYHVRFASDSTIEKVDTGIISDTVTNRKVLYVVHYFKEYEIELGDIKETERKKK